MTELRQINNQQFLQELKNRITNNQIAEEEVFATLTRKEFIADCEIASVDKLTTEDWKKACQMLEADKNYQAEVNLWDSIDYDDE